MKFIYKYKDGDDKWFIWNFWNPIVWVPAFLWLIAVVVVHTIADGVKNQDFLADAGFRLRKFFRKNPDKLEWLE